MPNFGSFIQAAIREGGFTGPTKPTIIAYLAGKSNAELAADKMMLSGPLMKELESFLAGAGVPINDGLKILKADAASDALVLTAKGLEGTDHDVVIKISQQKGIFTDHLHLKDEWVTEGVQRTFPSALNNKETVLVRIEPRLLPVDKAIASLPLEMRADATRKFNEAMFAKAKSKGLIVVDMKPNNFGIPVGSGPVKSIEDILAMEPKIMDLDAVRIPSAQARRDMANPGVEYKPELHTAPATHIDHIFETQAKTANSAPWVERVNSEPQPVKEVPKPAAPPVTLADKMAALRERMARLGIGQNEGGSDRPRS